LGDARVPGRIQLKARPYLRSVSLEGDVSTNAYPFNIPLISRLGKLDFHESVTFFVGENGSGKSTLLEAIAVAMGFGAEGGTKNILFETASTVSTLHQNLKLVKSFLAPKDHFFLRAESLYNVATFLDGIGVDMRSYGGSSLHECSHGEAFLRLMVHKFRGNGLYLLDEPEAALSPSRQLAALVRMHDLVIAESQFIIATHSPILMAYPDARIYLFDEAGHREIGYEETEHYKVTQDFLNNFPKRIETLLS
jgi:predicted ATPase